MRHLAVKKITFLHHGSEFRTRIQTDLFIVYMLGFISEELHKTSYGEQKIFLSLHRPLIQTGPPEPEETVVSRQGLVWKSGTEVTT
jgi:hypothetical protein